MEWNDISLHAVFSNKKLSKPDQNITLGLLKKKPINHKIHSVTLMRFVWLTECTILYVAFINNLLFGRLCVLTPHSSLCDSCSRLMFGDVAWRCNYAWWFNVLGNRLTVLLSEVPVTLIPGMKITNTLIRLHDYYFFILYFSFLMF